MEIYVALIIEICYFDPRERLYIRAIQGYTKLPNIRDNVSVK